jgi:hypothetical protein
MHRHTHAHRDGDVLSIEQHGDASFLGCKVKLLFKAKRSARRRMFAKSVGSDVSSEASSEHLH